jgi:YVTN family beta-propeller protein
MSTKTITLLAVVTVVVIGIAGIGDWLASAAPAEVLYFDLVVDGPRQLLYGSDKDGGTIQVISQGTLQVIDEVSVGSGPAGIDIKPDGTELAVALSGEGEIALLILTRLRSSPELFQQA